VTSDPYAALVLIAERERALVDDGRVEELAVLAAERDALIATMPAQAPPSARPALERAPALQMATAAMLRASLAEVRHAIAALDRGRGVARAYVVGPQAVDAPSVDAAA
jgi:hypothetical protein